MLSITSDTPMRGRLVAAGRIVLNSWFEGDVLCSRLELGPDGYVLGRVIARTVISEGQIVGPVTADRLSLLPGAFVEGDVVAASLEVSPGATLTGRSRRVPSIVYPAELLELEGRTSEGRAWGPMPERTPILRSTEVRGKGQPPFPLIRATRVMSL